MTCSCSPVQKQMLLCSAFTCCWHGCGGDQGRLLGSTLPLTAGASAWLGCAVVALLPGRLLSSVCCGSLGCEGRDRLNSLCCLPGLLCRRSRLSTWVLLGRWLGSHGLLDRPSRHGIWLLLRDRQGRRVAPALALPTRHVVLLSRRARLLMQAAQHRLSSATLPLPSAHSGRLLFAGPLSRSRLLPACRWLLCSSFTFQGLAAGLCWLLGLCGSCSRRSCLRR